MSDGNYYHIADFRINIMETEHHGPHEYQDINDDVLLIYNKVMHKCADGLFLLKAT